MRFDIELYESDAGKLIERLFDITGLEHWTKRNEWLIREVNENGYMRDWLRARCSLEWTAGTAITTGELLGASPFAVTSNARYELAAFAAAVTQVHNNLSSSGKKRLRGMLVDGLKSEKGLLALQHEISTAVHLVRSGFDVEFNDLESGGGFDFLATADGATIEVECKMFSADVGRQIHRRLAAKLFKVLESELTQVL